MRARWSVVTYALEGHYLDAWGGSYRTDRKPWTRR